MPVMSRRILRIHTGIRLNAQMIMCAPCCHKELRPQLKAPEVLNPMLQFGIHAGQQAGNADRYYSCLIARKPMAMKPKCLSLWHLSIPVRIK